MYFLNIYKETRCLSKEISCIVNILMYTTIKKKLILKFVNELITEVISINKRPMGHIPHLRLRDRKKPFIYFLRIEWFFI